MKVGRNEPCPCKSGKKYKHCCGAEAPAKSQRLAGLVLVLFVAVAVWVLGSRLIGSPGPESAAPPGKVWSQEHGHWHDAPDTSEASNLPGPGPTPPGKVWSAEHGHWHDAEGTAAQSTGSMTTEELEAQISAQLGTQITGLKKIERPKDMVWSEEHQHYHFADGREPLEWEPPVSQND